MPRRTGSIKRQLLEIIDGVFAGCSHPGCLFSGAIVLRYSAARRSRDPIVIVLLLVLVLDCPISDDENEDDDEDERFARPATIWTDTDRLQVCATGAAGALNTYIVSTLGTIGTSFRSGAS